MNTQIIAIANQKGGVGKTTTCANLGIGLAQAGKKVLLIDGDPQGSLTISLGNPQPDKLPFTLSDAMGKILMDQPIRPGEGILHHAEGVDLMPADIQLSGMEVSLVNAMSRETVLRQYLDTLKGQYSHILIDCQPSLGMLTVNALAAANRIIIPVQAEYLPAKGLEQLLSTVSKVKRQINPKLQIDGILLTMVDIYEQPQLRKPDTDSPDTENPYMDKPDTEKPAELNIEKSNTQKQNIYGSSTDSIPFRDCAADCLPERKGRDAMSLTEIESYRELIQENRTHNLKPKKGAQVMRKNEKITALYERLSRDDFGKDDDQQRESNSISNQKAMLEEFAARQGFTNIVHFTDDGISGTCFDRPGFLAMMKEVEAGNVEYRPHRRLRFTSILLGVSFPRRLEKWS